MKNKENKNIAMSCDLETDLGVARETTQERDNESGLPWL